MKYTYCLPIISPDRQVIINTIKQYKSEYSYFEVWLDYVKEYNLEFLTQLKRETDEKLVVVFRRQHLDPIEMSVKERYETLDALNGSEVLVDLDLISQQQEISYIRQKEHKLQTIISYHNYEETPATNELNKIVQQIRNNKPTILKIATNCQNKKDALRLLELLDSLHEEGQRCIILGMGHLGIITRIFGSTWGNELVFAPAKIKNATAPGQFTRKQLDNILQTIGE